MKQNDKLNEDMLKNNYDNVAIEKFEVNRSIVELMSEKKVWYPDVAKKAKEKGLRLSQKTLERCKIDYFNSKNKIKEGKPLNEQLGCYSITSDKYIFLLIALDIGFETAFKKVFADKKVDKLLENEEVKEYLSGIDYNILIDRNKFHNWIKNNVEKLDKSQKRMLNTIFYRTFHKDYINRVRFMKAHKFFNFVLFMISIKIDFKYE